jgi:DNA-binding NarL/FixJ family response regulator
VTMPTHTPITVVLARFEDLLALGLRALIEGDPSLAIVAADVEHRRIPVVLRAHRPDVAILDAGALARPTEVRELSGRHPTTRLILLAGLANGPAIAEYAQLLAFGASACLGRETQARDVRNAIYLASRGLQVIPRAATAFPAGARASGQQLTLREAEVLAQLQLGRSNAQVSLALQIGIETVRSHARNIYRKLGVSSRRELLAQPRPASEAGPRSPRRPTMPLAMRLRRGDGCDPVDTPVAGPPATPRVDQEAGPSRV